MVSSHTLDFGIWILQRGSCQRLPRGARFACDNGSRIIFSLTQEPPCCLSGAVSIFSNTEPNFEPFQHAHGLVIEMACKGGWEWACAAAVRNQARWLSIAPVLCTVVCWWWWGEWGAASSPWAACSCMMELHGDPAVGFCYLELATLTSWKSTDSLESMFLSISGRNKVYCGGI